MEVPFIPLVVPLVASLPQPIKGTLVDEKLVHIANDDQRGQNNDRDRRRDRRHGLQAHFRWGEPHKANSGTCILWTSTTEEEDSFVRYTLRMLLHDLYFEYC